jgi:hypothetical protein
MFELNRVDNALQQMTVPAEITLACGTVLKGKFIVAAARSIHDVLNGETKFLEFETSAGGRSLIAKSTLASVALLAAPSAGSLKARLQDGGDFDPHVVSARALGRDPAGIPAVLQGLSSRSFLNIALPPEVRDYLVAMARRINTACHALEVPQPAAKRAVIEKSKPVYTSAPRV